MAIYNSFLATSIKQSAGNITFTTWKGKRILKEKVTTYSDRKTPTQLNNRARLTTMSWAGAAFKSAYQTGFRKAAIGKTEYNVFSSKEQNYPLSSTTTSSVFNTLDPGFIKLSKGNLPVLTGLSIAPTANTGEFTISWDIGIPNMPADAQVRLVGANPSRAITSGEEYAEDVDLGWNLIAYSVGTATVNTELTSPNFWVLGYVVSAEQNDVSNTINSQLI